MRPKPERASSASTSAAPVLTHIGVDFGGFEPTTLSRAPCRICSRSGRWCIFGKWKGNATGTITLRGKSGAGEYVQAVSGR